MATQASKVPAVSFASLVRALADDMCLDTMHPMAREGTLKAIVRTLGIVKTPTDAKSLLAEWEKIVW